MGSGYAIDLSPDGTGRSWFGGAEITLPDGTVLHPGTVVDTDDFPGLEAAIAAKAAVLKDERADAPLRMK
jgi:hypothetical protein